MPHNETEFYKNDYYIIRNESHKLYTQTKNHSYHISKLNILQFRTKNHTFCNKKMYPFGFELCRIFELQQHCEVE